jgi:hypothetical protein
MKRPRCLLGTETVKVGSRKRLRHPRLDKSCSIAWRCSLTTTLRNFLRTTRKPRRRMSHPKQHTGQADRGRLGDIANSVSVSSGPFVRRYARVSKKAPVGLRVHQSAAFLTGHASGGYFGHGDLVSRPATAFMRSCPPLYELGHAWTKRWGWRSNAAIFRVYCQSST